LALSGIHLMQSIGSCSGH